MANKQTTTTALVSVATDCWPLLTEIVQVPVKHRVIPAMPHATLAMSSLHEGTPFFSWNLYVGEHGSRPFLKVFLVLPLSFSQWAVHAFSPSRG